jgi:hypothetical protein
MPILHSEILYIIPSATYIDSLLKSGREFVLSLLRREAHGAALAAAPAGAAPPATCSPAAYTSMPIWLK